MATVHFKVTTTSTPEQFIAGLTDFGPGRAELWGNSADSYLEVYDVGSDHADVKEGSAGTWERLHYDWSNPEHIILTTVDSNTWGGKSGHSYTLTRNPDGTTDIDVVVVRDAKSTKGWLLVLVLKTVGRNVLSSAFAKTVKAIEARNAGTSAATAA
jgi:hypothetical protein